MLSTLRAIFWPALLLWFSLWMVALSVPAALAQSTDDLVVRTFGTEPADYLFLIDTSQGMLPQAEALRAPLAEMIAQIPAGDRVGILAYHTRPSEVLSMQAIDEPGRAALVEKIKALPLTSAKETDLGAGLSAVADTLGRAGSARVQFLILISDFCHNPSVQSRYDSGGRGCRSIRELDELAKHFQISTREHLLTVQYLSLTREGSAAPLSHAEARRVAGEGQLAGDPSAWLRGYAGERLLRRYGPVAQDWAARLTVGMDADGPISAADPDVALKVRVSPPVKLLLLAPEIQGGTLSGLPSDGAGLTVEDGALIPLSVPLPVISGAILPRTEDRPIPVTLQAAAVLQPEVAWKAVGVDPQRPAQQWAVTVHSSIEAGSRRRLIGVILLALVAVGIGGALARQRLNRWELGGTFWWRHGNDPRQPLEVGKRQQLAVAINDKGEVIAGDPGDSKALLLVWRTGLRTAMVDVRREGVEINARAVAPGRHPILPAAASFRYGEYRLTWE